MTFILASWLGGLPGWKRTRRRAVAIWRILRVLTVYCTLHVVDREILSRSRSSSQVRGYKWSKNKRRWRLMAHWVCSGQLFGTLQPTCWRFECMQNQSSSMFTLSSIKPEMNGFGRYRAVTCEFFHVKTAYFRQLNAHKRVPFHPGTLVFFVHWTCIKIQCEVVR